MNQVVVFSYLLVIFSYIKDFLEIAANVLIIIACIKYLKSKSTE